MSGQLDIARVLYEREVKAHVLALREALVRHDENLAAHALLTHAVPYFLKEDPDIARARDDQYEMVRHIIEPPAYADYYANNPHERPFEEQYGIEPEVAHEYLYRVQFLREELATLSKRRDCAPGELRILDLSANDGWMAVNLGELGYVVDCIDLHPGNCAKALERKTAGAAGIGMIECCDLHELASTDGIGGCVRSGYDAVICFETLEHVREPRATLDVMRRLVADEGRIFVSTPFEAIERGNVPNWDHVEPKGHVRAVRPQDLAEWLLEVGEIDRFELGPDRVMVASVKPGR